MKGKRLIVLVLVIVLAGTQLFSACKKKTPQEESTESIEESQVIEESSVPVKEISVQESVAEESSEEESSEEESSEEESVPELDPEDDSMLPIPEGYLNTLTGLYTMSKAGAGKRPVAIMVNNHLASLPQYGIACADIILECLAEHGITRFMAIYADQTQIPNVCSIRSARPYYVEFAAGFDAVYVCVGGSSDGLKAIKTLGIARFNGTYSDKNLFRRDQERLKTYALEHTMYFIGSNVPSSMKSYGFRINSKEDFKEPYFNFRHPDLVLSTTDVPATMVDLKYSKAYYSTFTYNEEDSLYYKQHSGRKQIDQATGEQLAFTNLLILQSAQSYDKKGLRVVDTKGGTGYYVTNGTVEEITWSKASPYEKLFVYNADGDPLRMNAGKTYIGMIGFDGTVTIE
ncbi:MAG: DUF3048 domain-containing protein [Firmicutes bacterium]|nr:DUF3048 domain-containing protein [Bacillota bacterium]